MTPGARLQAAIDLFQNIEQGSQPADSVLDSYFRGKRYVGAKDRRAIAHRVFDGLRRRARLDWWIARVQPDDATPPLAARDLARLRILAELALVDRESQDGITRLFNGGRHCPEELNPFETTIISGINNQALDHPDMPPWIAFEYPQWLDPHLQRVWGNDLPTQMNALNEPASLDLRVNTLKIGREKAIASLSRDNVDSHITTLSPIGLRIRGRLRLGGVRAFRDGLIEVQDEGSQILSLITDAQPNMTVIDYCAGAGGKTLALAADMKNRGRIIACDISNRRLKRMDGRLKRSGVKITTAITLSPQDGVDPLSAYTAQADRVLVDAPCTGTGTWRRNPESRWLLDPSNLDDLCAQQARILDAAAEFTKPGGRLVYATCSILDQENERQAESFLARHNNYKAVPAEQIWPSRINGPFPGRGPWLRLSPAVTNTDGFFAAVFERIS